MLSTRRLISLASHDGKTFDSHQYGPLLGSQFAVIDLHTLGPLKASGFSGATATTSNLQFAIVTTSVVSVLRVFIGPCHQII